MPEQHALLYNDDQTLFVRRRTQRDLSALIEGDRARLDRGEELDAVVAVLRAAGVEFGDSITVLAAATGMRRREAKAVVHASDAWADMRPALDRVHAAEEAAKQMAQEGSARLLTNDRNADDE